MSLQKKIMMILAGIWIGILVSIFVISETVVLNAFVKLEDDAAHRNLARVKEILQEKVATLTRLNLDWSSWDETHHSHRAGTE